MTISLDVSQPGKMSLDDAKSKVNTWTEDVVAVFDSKNGCVLFTPNFSYNGKYNVCYADNKEGFMDSIQLGNALKAKDIAFGVTVPNTIKEISEDSIPSDYVIDPPLTQPAVTILTVKTPPSVTMLHVDRDKGTIAYKTGKTPNLTYDSVKGWTVGSNMTLIILIVVVICCCCCVGLFLIL